ncbi:MAG: ATP:cob(I)alamin adenosyltransferase [Candidatus Marinimicrobia bacterium]|nr:ATP:cob(I)alamin adenosyltransferase [Candidatus Neomarinimicrobiota bacterium]|tara:strand:+ start:9373 stop:9915 length:543 start_codon:yes stop_codon:yes gene_type:complete
MRISKVTTKTGDKGQTELSNGQRVSKSHLRIKTMGSIDHLNSIIGWVVSVTVSNVKRDLKSIQQDLFNIGGELSMPDSKLDLLKNSRIIWLESEIERLNSDLPPLKEFILPGGTELSSRIHIARTECRNVERDLVSLGTEVKLYHNHLVYLNRLSDYLFVLARSIQSGAREPEDHWNYRK